MVLLAWWVRDAFISFSFNFQISFGLFPPKLLIEKKRRFHIRVTSIFMVVFIISIVIIFIIDFSMIA